ncbi:MAG: hypothetical protein JXP39_00930 [Spirochaetales bacterium]|nr:hypothetical protein [Spirochaetales bacterium]
MNTRALLLASLLVYPAVSAYTADSFRVRSLVPVSIQAHSETQTIEMGYNDALGIAFEDDAVFIRGVEIEIKPPQAILEYRNSLAWGLYSAPSPQPDPSVIDYKAVQLALNTLPSRLSFILQIPLKQNHGFKAGPYATVLQSIVDPAKGPVLFRLFPVMKGLPDNIETLRFVCRIKPLLTDEGGALLDITRPGEQHPISVRVDETLVQNTGEMLILKPGSHHLSIVSEDYRDEVRVFTVESARVTELKIELKDTIPRILVTAPENARMKVNGQETEVRREPFPVDPGTYTFSFALGDWEISRQLTVEKGRDYAINLKLDLEISESPEISDSPEKKE